MLRLPLLPWLLLLLSLAVVLSVSLLVTCVFILAEIGNLQVQRARSGWSSLFADTTKLEGLCTRHQDAGEATNNPAQSPKDKKRCHITLPGIGQGDPQVKR